MLNNASRSLCIRSGLYQFALCNFFILLLRLLCIYCNNLELYADEAQYWLWSLTPDFGYYSKPPMIAWIIWITTRLGDGEFYIRLASPILYSLSAFLVYGITRQISSYSDIPNHSISEKVAFWAGLAYLTMPAISVGAMLITTDALLLLFWALCLYCMLRASKTMLSSEKSIVTSNMWWLATGLAAGFGMLSKSSMLLFLPIALWWLWRYVPKFYLKVLWTLLAAVIIYLPNCYWNLTNKMATVHHVTDLVLGSSASNRLWSAFSFLLAQIGINGPLLAGLTVYLLWQQRRLLVRDQIASLIWAFTLVPLLVVFGVGFVSKAYANWAAPAYVTLFIALSYIVSIGSSLLLQRLFYLGVTFNMLVGLIVILYPLLFSWGIVPTGYDPLRRLKGGKELGTHVCMEYEKYSQSHPGDIMLVSDERKELALISYYCARNLQAAYQAKQLVKWNPQHQIRDHFDLTTDLNSHLNSDLLLVSRHLTLHDVQKYAPSAQVYNQFANTHGGYIYTYTVFAIKNFQGY